jgi:hypothetical protein
VTRPNLGGWGHEIVVSEHVISVGNMKCYKVVMILNLGDWVCYRLVLELLDQNWT